MHAKKLNLNKRPILASQDKFAPLGKIFFLEKLCSGNKKVPQVKLKLYALRSESD